MADSVSFDGLVAIGVIDRVEPVVFGQKHARAGEVVPGMGKLFLRTELGEVRVDLQDTETTMQGRRPIPAFTELTAPAVVGKRVAIKVYLVRSGGYTNLVAAEVAFLAAGAVKAAA
jgi:hypothetical protein